MELIVLKIPPDRLRMVADAIDRDIMRGPQDSEAADLHQVLVWLRYRYAKWHASHPATPTG